MSCMSAGCLLGRAYFRTPLIHDAGDSFDGTYVSLSYAPVAEDTEVSSQTAMHDPGM